MSISSPGLLETIHFVTDDTFARPLRPEEVEVEVKATGLNFRDMIVLLGQTSSNQVGLECAGVVTRAGEGVESSIRTGTRVCCIPEGTYKIHTRAKAALVAKIPDSVSFVSAAAIRMAYCTAWYSLYDLGRNYNLPYLSECLVARRSAMSAVFLQTSGWRASEAPHFLSGALPSSSAP